MHDFRFLHAAGDAYVVFASREEAERAIEGKYDGRTSIQLFLTTKGEIYGHLAQYERNVSKEANAVFIAEWILSDYYIC